MNPPWWTDEHTSSWERVKHALHRDWEQTKGDLTDNGVDLNQGASDTIRQAVGKQQIPPDGFPNPGPRHGGPADWNALEPALRFGHGARHHYADRVWNEELTTQLREDWESSKNEGTWESAKLGIERGWHSVRRAL